MMKISLRSNASRPLLAASLAVLLAFGCSDQGTEPPTSPVATPDLSARAGQPSASQQDLGPALAAQKRHGDRLMAIAGVVGHGVGLVDGEPGIKVFLLRPGVAGVPSRLDDIPVAVEVTGMFVAGGTTATTRPAPNGYSVGHPDITAGTLGAIVKDADDVCYILSNNHVLANSNDASLGDRALQPGPFDGGQDPEHAIATLSDFEPIKFDGSDNTIDAAIAELISPTFVTAETPTATGYGAPGTGPPVGASVGQQLQKFGRTTLLTNGEVKEIEVTANICYECGGGPFCMKCNKLARFVDLVATEDMSGGGDSGSLMVTLNKEPVALLFAGSSARTLGNPIGAVLNRFNVTIETDLAQCADGGGAPPPDPVTTDIAVTAVSAPASVTQGKVVSVDVTVENVGNQDVSDINVMLMDDTDGVTIGTQTIAGGLTASASATLTYSWETDGASLGDHTLTASNGFTDDDATNNSLTTTVTVNELTVGTAPGVDACSPDIGNPGDRLTVVVSGSNFQDGVTVNFGERVTVQSVTFVSSIQLNVQIKVHRRANPGLRDVTVTNPDGQSGMAGCFSVTP
jgi:hypothetical protein